MFSTVFHRISGLFASKSAPECRFLLLGLDAAGKTTLLYSLRGGNEVVTTIPTIGFNVETVEVKNTSITCWDVGGCDKIRPLWRHYTRSSSAIIFVVDSNDIERIEDAKTELMLFLREEDLRGAPLLVIANKQDLPRAQSLDILINSLGLQDVTNRPWYIRGACATANVGVKQSFIWLEAILRGSKLTSAELEGGVTCYEFFEKHSCGEDAMSCEPTRTATMFDPRRLPAEKVSVPERESWKLRQDTISSWVDRIDDSNEDFLLKLSNYELESWDHYTHIRIGFLLIATYGVQRGFCEAEERISSFIANSSRTNGKSFHRTMTRFWMHMIAYCMYYHDICDRGEFKRFLRIGPSTYDAELWDGKLFSAYYSNALLFASSARTGIVSPDKRSLPNLCDLLHRSISYQESRGRGDAAIDDPQQKRIALMISDLSYLQKEGQYAVASALGIQA